MASVMTEDTDTTNGRSVYQTVDDGWMRSMDFKADITVPTEEHLEKLRRFVDEWCGTVRNVTDELEGASTGKWTWGVGDIAADPIRLAPTPVDVAKAQHLVSAENPAFASVTKVFSYLAAKVATLKQEAEREFFPRLLMFGERCGEADMAPEGEVQIMLAKSLPALQLLVAFIDQLQRVAHQLLHQLAALYSEKLRVYATFHQVHMHMAFRALADAMTVMVTLDELMKQNPSFRGAFAPFKRLLLTVRKDPERFGVEETEARQLEHTMMELEGRLMPPRAFQEFLETQELQPALTGARFLEEAQASCAGMLGILLGRIGTGMERPHDRTQVMGVLTLFVLRASLGGGTCGVERKLTKVFLDVHLKVPLVPLYINTTVQPSEYLMQWLPDTTLAGLPNATDRAAASARERQEYLDRIEATLERDVAHLVGTVSAWIARLESCLPPKVALQTVLSRRLKLVVQGLYLANRLSMLVTTIMHLHVALQQPISKAEVRCVAQCLEMLKAIQSQYVRRAGLIASSATHLLFFAQCKLHTMLAPVRDQLNADLTALRANKTPLKSFFSSTKGSEEMKLDALAAATLAMDALGGPATADRRILLQLAVDVLRDTHGLNPNTLSDIEEMVHLMELTVELMPLTEQLCDCSFLYFTRELIGASLSDAIVRPEQAHKLRYLFAAFRDAESLLRAGRVPDEVLAAFRAEMDGLVDNKMMKPLCTAIENDLRLHIHSARLTGVVTVNPVKTGVRDISRFLQVRPLRLAHTTVHIRTRVEDYLNATFHNHTALALHNWKTYGEMRKLAQEKYGISLAEITLPGQTLEQGLDVLEVMRNIHLFVAKYHYNLHSQVFIEAPLFATGKTLNTIGIRHVANSIRTHGMGIMNTAVNFAYQFLAKKFNVFSQFLYDDHIRSRLLNEVRYFSEHRVGLENHYPIERAEKLCKGIRALGLSDEGLSFLDQFRRLVAEIGNALGFVRMLRLGGMHYCQNATKFVPDLGKVGASNLEKLAVEEGLSEGTVQASKNLDVVLNGLRENSSEGVDYFQVLVDVFSNELNASSNAHLQDFHMILPALFLSHVESMVQSKDRLYKRTNFVAASFTDDGLLLGVAYLLEVLRQGRQLDALHLFESANSYYEARQRQAEQRAADPHGVGSREEGADDDDDDGLVGRKSDPARGTWRQRNAARAHELITEEENQNQRLRIQRFKNFQSEWMLLKYSFSGARVFFHVK